MNRSRRPLIAGNWKLNHGGASACTLAATLPNEPQLSTRSTWSSPRPLPRSPAVARRARGHQSHGRGAEHVPQGTGAFTGEVSAPMLLESGASGPSSGTASDDSISARPMLRWRRRLPLRLKGLRPIACVGETLAEREKGDTLTVVGRQIDAFAKILASQVELGHRL